MNDEATRFPLTWPAGWTRTPRRQRGTARFRQSAGNGSGAIRQSVDRRTAKSRLIEELRLLGATSVVISTNVPPKALLDHEPENTGVAVYFKLQGKQRCLACDRWSRVADNIVAVTSHIDALRSIERWGVGTIEQAFVGYAALPPSPEDWWLVLDIPQSSSLEQVNAAFKRKALAAHPDRGGSHEEMSRLSAARDVGRRALSSGASS